MKVVKKNVYYCDFCKKKSLKSLRNHELHCTNNLDRECRLCKTKHDYRSIVDKFKKRFTIEMVKDDYFDDGVLGTPLLEESINWVDGKITGDEIVDLVDGCPICALTIIKALAKNKNISRLLNFDFDYKTALAIWWDEVNRQQEERWEYL